MSHNENSILLSQNFITNTEQVKQFRICLFNKDKTKTLELLDILLKKSTISKLITEIINIWIEYYLYKTFYLGVIFISINTIKITKLNKPYIICLLKYTINILLLHDYNKDIVKQDKANVLDFSNIEKLRELNIEEENFKLFNVNNENQNDNDNLSFKALYISYKNNNYEFLIKSLNTLLLHINQIDILHNLWNFILHINEDFDYPSKLCFQLCNMKILKKSSKYIILYYIYLLHIQHFQLNDFFEKLEETLGNIDKFKKTYSIHNASNQSNNIQDDDECKKVIKEDFNYYIVKEEDTYNMDQIRINKDDEKYKKLKKFKKIKKHKHHQYHQSHEYNKDKRNIEVYKNIRENSSHVHKKINIDTKEIVANIIDSTHINNNVETKKSKNEIKMEEKKKKEQTVNENMKYLMYVPMKEQMQQHSNINKFDYIPHY